VILSRSRQLYQARDLLWSWTLRTIRARYQQSALGWLWAVFQPAAQVVIFTVVFTVVVQIDTEGVPYPVFSYIAIVPWTLLASSLADMAQALVANMSLVGKIYFPREVLPVAAMLARLMDFAVAAVLLVVLMAVYALPFPPIALLYLPLILSVQLLLILGLGLLAAAANVFFRDVQSLITLGLQLWFYVSPIIYPVSMVPEQLRPVYFLNPMAGILEAYRDVLLHASPPGDYLMSSAVASLATFLFGFWFFKRLEFRFADVI
jgi:lipopolysaccharide transport system permease protein